MAVDEALARTGEEGVGVLRIYRWARPTLSFGRNQPALDRYDPMAARALGVEVVRRPTGGREVLHDRELTYSVTAPIEGPGDLRAAYRILNQALVEALRSIGIPARMAVPSGRTPDPGAGACFQAPAEGEVEVEGRKLVGSAQVRIEDRLLQHGSLLLGRPSVELAALGAPGASSGTIAAGDGFTTLEEVSEGPVAFERVAAAVEAGMAGVLGGRWSRDEIRPEEREVASELLQQYQSSGWTWRR
jgi:lipoyl(octanoyl) transferase